MLLPQLHQTGGDRTRLILRRQKDTRQICTYSSMPVPSQAKEQRKASRQTVSRVHSHQQNDGSR